MWNTQLPFDSWFDDFRRFDRLWPSLFGTAPWDSGIRSVPYGTYPQVNIGSSAESVDVYVFAPGLDPDQLAISLQQNLLTIAGQRQEEYPQNAAYYRRKRFNGEFRRVLTLPQDVDPDAPAWSGSSGAVGTRRILRCGRAAQSCRSIFSRKSSSACLDIHLLLAPGLAAAEAGTAVPSAPRVQLRGAGPR